MEAKLLIVPFFFVNYASSLIIPEELSSLLSVAYSNIPPIKKGTDSRVGFGFAFGNHADFQVVYELGPQTNTAKIGSSFASNSKRQVSGTPAPNKNRQKLKGTVANNYLLGWADSMSKGGPPAEPAHAPRPGDTPNLEESLVDLKKNERGEYEIRQPPPANMPAQVLQQLKKLYGQSAEKGGESPEEQLPRRADLGDNYEALSRYRAPQRSPEEQRRITADLANVDLD